jgi:hypothetical protein
MSLLQLALSFYEHNITRILCDIRVWWYFADTWTWDFFHVQGYFTMSRYTFNDVQAILDHANGDFSFGKIDNGGKKTPVLLYITI